jgi:hypothetical protein
MKTTRLLITLAAFGAFTFGPGFAGEPPGPARETALPGKRVAGRRADEKPGQSHASVNSSQAKGTKPTVRPHSGPKPPQPFQANGGHPGEKRTNNAQNKGMSGNAAELRQPGLNKSAGGARTGSPISAMETQRRLPAAGRSGMPPANPLVPHRGPGPAIVGGPTMSMARNAAVINGTGMRHRP